MQSMPITIKVESSSPIHGEVYSIQHYVIKVCQWLATGQWSSLGTPVSSTNKTDHHDMNIGENGVYHHNPNPSVLSLDFDTLTTTNCYQINYYDIYSLIVWLAIVALYYKKKWAQMLTADTHCNE